MSVRLCEAAAAACRRAQEVVARSVRGRTERYAVPVGRGERLVKRCAWCDRIRSVTGAWRELRSAVRMEVDVLVSHGICADCRDRLYPLSRSWLDAPAERLGAAKTSASAQA